jgi:hypothetical protein
MNGFTNLLVNEISDFMCVSRTGELYEKYMFSQIPQLSMMFDLMAWISAVSQEIAHQFQGLVDHSNASL